MSFLLTPKVSQAVERRRRRRKCSWRKRVRASEVPATELADRPAQMNKKGLGMLDKMLYQQKSYGFAFGEYDSISEMKNGDF